ncbi:PREDICTED: L10-interacting MYB domain-containing protein-like isoform X2 [Lupinus angustifolius]|uniref:L10-interacting MYB domain-containing protein-like isoform X2 n=1 Tax=Lupinus angustifolius TaxID=3871 RepID=UPI00092FD9AE|nr:PREDICTED: L10-interacting MYB domain-containing protein-like isoform X2 [Lupinus angustifolius]
MEDDCSISLDNLRANWTPSQDEYFLELMLTHVHKGNKTGKTFTRQAWADMIDQFNTKFGFKYDVDVLKNRHKRFRKQYNEIKMNDSRNDLQWDGTLNMVMADDKTWHGQTKAHAHVQPYRTRVIPNYIDLCIIFGHAVADGRYSLSCFDVDFECEEIASKQGDDQAATSKGLDDQTSPIVINQSKIDWSPMMDRFFVQLMLDQVCKGNKVGHTFKRKAWADMSESFNDRFGCYYGKVVLKNRFNVLRKHYSSINVLLAKEGFSWDKKEQNVVADDDLWQNCIQVNHNFRLYRTKSMPFYSSMCIICRNEATVSCLSNLQNGYFEGKNSTPVTQSFPNAADKGALYIGVEWNSNADKGTMHIGGENVLTGEAQALPHADKDALHIDGEKNSTRETQPLPYADKELLLGGGENVYVHPKRRPPNTPEILNESKKARKYNEGMAVTMKHMTVAVTSLTKKIKKEDGFSIDNVITVLQAIPNMDDDLILDACDFLEDERRARMFLALDANFRKKWLLRKLRSE